LSIGDFAARCELSAKMLRSYAAAGLLVPAAVDASSGYRYYSTSQLHSARIIALLRRAGIAVDDIAEFFRSPDAADFDRWDLEIVRQTADRRQALGLARAAMAIGHAPPSPRSDDVQRGQDMTHEFSVGTATHIGGRDSQQDAVLVSEDLFAVADGLGGLQDGEVASRLALDTVNAAFAADHSISGLLNAGLEANKAVWRQATVDGEDAKMGTTLAAVAMTSDAGAVVLHAGDSRLYHFRGGRLDQCTHDHTVVADLIRAGEVSEEEAETHPYRHVLTRALGVGPNIEIDHARIPCQSGDRLLLCTDGMFKALSSDDVRAVLASEEEAQESADRLVASAVGRGAEDNVTVLVIDVQ
jgi:serine/threonine protein phosphatase PrpC/DNA-binding transcriptional MerR regulator